MKKIGKLTINPEKVIKNEELVNLKGGYDVFWTWTCTCEGLSPDFWFEVIGGEDALLDAQDICLGNGGTGTTYCVPC